MSARLALVGLLLTASVATATAQQAPTIKPGAPAGRAVGRPAAPPPAAAQPPAIAPGHLALAREVMLNSGLARSIDSIIPTMAEQIRKNSVTRPELAGDLDEVLKGLKPELDLQKERMIDIAARIYAKRLSEAELGDIAAFFRSPAGRRYVETQPQMLDDMVGAMQDWTGEVSEYVMVRTRAEMGKRGHALQ